MNDECTCLTTQPKHADFEKVRHVGIDEKNGRFGEVDVEKCRLCAKLWITYRVEYEAFTKSGRWFRGVISPEDASKIKADEAVEVIEGLEFHLYGGSYFGRFGRSTGKIHVDP